MNDGKFSLEESLSTINCSSAGIIIKLIINPLYPIPRFKMDQAGYPIPAWSFISRWTSSYPKYQSPSCSIRLRPNFENMGIPACYCRLFFPDFTEDEAEARLYTQHDSPIDQTSCLYCHVRLTANISMCRTWTFELRDNCEQLYITPSYPRHSFEYNASFLKSGAK